MLQPLIDLLKDFLGVFQFWKVVKCYDRAAQLRLGKFLRILEPGFYLCYPFYIDTFDEVCVVEQPEKFDFQALETKDEQKVVLKVSLLIEIQKPKKFLIEATNQRELLEDRAAGWISRHIESHTWNELREEGLRDRMLEAVVDLMKPLGVKVNSVQILTFSRMPSYHIVGSLVEREAV